ncbi:MAG: hypothetical protein ACI8T1_002984 [Verrucomicrobiales bacterium]|jgi:hypothetical protein
MERLTLFTALDVLLCPRTRQRSHLVHSLKLRCSISLIEVIYNLLLCAKTHSSETGAAPLTLTSHHGARIKSQPSSALVPLVFAILGLALTSAISQTEILSIEFIEDDQDDFELRPSPLAAPSSTADFATDSAATSGSTMVTVTTITGFGLPANRGNLVDEEPTGFTLSGMYQDLLHATSPTGFMTLDFSRLNANQSYLFTLYAWDPGATDGSDKEWTVTEGAGDLTVYAVNFQDPLVDNDSFALVFDITTTSTGTFQLTNTDGLPQSAINGFKLEQVAGAPTLSVTQEGSDLAFEWESSADSLYNLESSADLVTWAVGRGARRHLCHATRQHGDHRAGG